MAITKSPGGASNPTRLRWLPKTFWVNVMTEEEREAAILAAIEADRDYWECGSDQ